MTVTYRTVDRSNCYSSPCQACEGSRDASASSALGISTKAQNSAQDLATDESCRGEASRRSTESLSPEAFSKIAISDIGFAAALPPLYLRFLAGDINSLIYSSRDDLRLPLISTQQSGARDRSNRPENRSEAISNARHVPTYIYIYT